MGIKWFRLVYTFMYIMGVPVMHMCEHCQGVSTTHLNSPQC